jgi:hypothetical protein
MYAHRVVQKQGIETLTIGEGVGQAIEGTRGQAEYKQKETLYREQDRKHGGKEARVLLSMKSRDSYGKEGKHPSPNHQ